MLLFGFDSGCDCRHERVGEYDLFPFNILAGHFSDVLCSMILLDIAMCKCVSSFLGCFGDVPCAFLTGLHGMSH